MASTKSRRFPALSDDVDCDVVIVGAGIAGLSCAYELGRAGQAIILLDRDRIASGVTSRTTAHLTPICDDTISEMIELRGESVSRCFYESQAAAVDRIEAICSERTIQCNFRRLDGVLFPALGMNAKEAKDFLDKEADAAGKVGAVVIRSRGVPFERMEEAHTLRYPGQATFHPLKYVNGLVEAILERKGRIFERTPVRDVNETRSGITVATSTGRVVRARHAVIATNSPIVDHTVIHSKQVPYRTYAMAFTIPRSSLPDALYWDTAEPYHYVRLNPGPGSVDYLIAGGADHKTGEADDGDIRFEAIEAWMRSLLPRLGREVHRWSGQVLDTSDYSADIGPKPGAERIFVVTGDSGQGMTHGALSGMLLRDLILTGTSPWQHVYDPARMPIRAAASFLRDRFSAAKDLAGSTAPGELVTFDELAPGRGAIVSEGLRKFATYRDESGRLHKLSPICTHSRCNVRWNSTETCWDCPCHGCHFSIDGEVLNGPARHPLAHEE
jgi:glycine/D-amino acid oxidase-like deaminating enzyme/nitrite reductase/ring-hydroxylating ferredoxin subunit